MQSVGLSLDEIIDALSAHDTGQATCESEGWRLDAALARVDIRIAELKALRRQIIDPPITQAPITTNHLTFKSTRRFILNW
jgi:DNA-binding transcriptional MerR regulator